MPNFIIILCTLVACVAGHPGVIAPLGYSTPLAYSSPLGYPAPLTYSTPYGYSFAAGGSSRIDIYNKFALQFAAVAVPASSPLRYSAPVGIAAPVALSTRFASATVAVPAPLRYSAPALAPIGGIPAPVAPAPVAVPAPLAAAPLRYSAPALAPEPVAVPAPLAAAPFKYSAPALAPIGGIAAPVAVAPAVPATLSYKSPPLTSNVLNRYSSAFYGTPLSYAFSAGLPLAARFSTAPLSQFAAPLAAAAPDAADEAHASVPSESEKVSDKLVEVPPTAADEQVSATPAPVDDDTTVVIRNASGVTQSPVAPVRSN